MKILTLNANLKRVGTYQRCFYFSRELARHGHDVTMVTVSCDSRFRTKTCYKASWQHDLDAPAGVGPWVRLVEGPSWGYRLLPGWGSNPLDIWHRTARILKEGFDIVYGFEYQPNVSWPVYLTRRSESYRFYSDWCDWYAGGSNRLRGVRIAHKIDGFFEERIRFLAHKVTTISRALEERARSIGIAAQRIVRIPQGVDTEYVRPLPKQRMRQKFKLPADDPIVAIVRDGDMGRAVSIFSHVVRELPRARLLVVGSRDEEVAKTAARLNIAKSVIETGWVSDAEYVEYLSCADVCFLPLEEGVIDCGRWPAKVNDYLAVGVATVINRVGDVAGLFETNEIGLLAEQNDEVFSERVLALLNDPERRAYLGRNARELMVNKWDWSVRGEQIAAVVEGG